MRASTRPSGAIRQSDPLGSLCTQTEPNAATAPPGSGIRTLTLAAPACWEGGPVRVEGSDGAAEERGCSTVAGAVHADIHAQTSTRTDQRRRFVRSMGTPP